jgi:hypothetical protein
MKIGKFDRYLMQLRWYFPLLRDENRVRCGTIAPIWNASQGLAHQAQQTANHSVDFQAASRPAANVSMGS